MGSEHSQQETAPIQTVFSPLICQQTWMHESTQVDIKQLSNDAIHLLLLSLSHFSLCADVRTQPLFAIVLKTSIPKTQYTTKSEILHEFADSVIGYFFKFYLSLDAGKKATNVAPSLGVQGPQQDFCKCFQAQKFCSEHLKRVTERMARNSNKV